MNNQQIIKQLTKDINQMIKDCKEINKDLKLWNEIVFKMEEDDGRCCCEVCTHDRCEGCGVCFNQNEEVLWDKDISPIWFYHQDIGNDDGDLCADCILKLDYNLD